MDRRRIWPALDVEMGRLKAAPTSESASAKSVGDGLSRPDSFQAALTDFDIIAIDESVADRWRIFFANPAERDRAAKKLTVLFPDLSMKAVDVSDEDWAARAQASLRAVQVGRIIVAPPWDTPITIVIKPSMGFGTGHHATTRLCLDALQHVEVADQTVLDIGTGSGVLAIAASLLGGSEVTGVDDDADAIQAAWDNLALNTGAVVSLIVGDVRSIELNAADIVLANVTGGMLTSSADRLRRLIAPHGRLIMSGFLTHEEADVLAAYGSLSVERRNEEEDWVCVTLRVRAD